MATVTLGGTPAKTNGSLPENGTQLDNYTLLKQDLSPISLADLKGKKVILNVFPSIDTGVCSASVRKFNEKAAGLDNTTVLSVSMDLPFALARFCGAEGIDNVVATSDFKSGGLVKALGLRLEDGGFEGLAARAVVVLDEEGKVSYTQLVDEIGNEPDYEAAIASL